MTIASPIFSLADPVEIDVPPFVFTRLGESFEGEHVVVLFKSVAGLALKIDYENPEPLNRYCTMFNIVNNRNTLYGHLFVVDEDKLTIEANRMRIECGDTSDVSYVQQALNNDKTKLIMLRNDPGSLVAILIGAEDKRYLVEDN